MKRIILSLIATIIGLILGYTGYTLRANQLKLQLDLSHTKQQKIEIDNRLNEQLQKTQQLEKVKEDLEVQLQSKQQQQAVLASVKRVEASTAPANCEAYRSIISQYNWNVDTAMRVMFAESGCRYWALNNTPATGDYSVGLFQINLYGRNAINRPSEAQLKDPATNIAWAYKFYAGNGNSFIGQWGVCRKAVVCY